MPILTVLALTGKLGAGTREGWRLVPQLPFELAAFPHAWFQHLRLPVVSYALPALIAIGQVRHHFSPSRNPVARLLRDRVRGTTHDLLLAMQPDSGGYLEATPLTSFVVMSLAGMRRTDSAVVQAGIRFLTDSMRDDGSWPIDTNLSTWVTTLSIDALGAAGAVPREDAGGDAGVAASSAKPSGASVHARGAGRVGVDAVERRRAGCRRHLRRTRRLAASRRFRRASPCRRQLQASSGSSAFRMATAESRHSAAGGVRCRSIAALLRSPRMHYGHGATGSTTSTRRCSAGCGRVHGGQ